MLRRRQPKPRNRLPLAILGKLSEQITLSDTYIYNPTNQLQLPILPTIFRFKTYQSYCNISQLRY